MTISAFFVIGGGFLIVPEIMLVTGIAILNAGGLSWHSFGDLRDQLDRLFADSVRNAPFDHRDLHGVV